jgi:hypothetical protein
MARPKPLFLVQCVSRKRSTTAAARDLYQSDWFRKARAYVESQGGSWFILSGKHHLLDPTKRIEPYNITLNQMSAASRREWADTVLGQLRPHCPPGSEVVVLAGDRYREHLVSRLKEWRCHVRVPLLGLGIGKQLAWLKRHAASLSGRS